MQEYSDSADEDGEFSAEDDNIDMDDETPGADDEGDMENQEMEEERTAINLDDSSDDSSEEEDPATLSEEEFASGQPGENHGPVNEELVFASEHEAELQADRNLKQRFRDLQRSSSKKAMKPLTVRQQNAVSSIYAGTAAGLPVPVSIPIRVQVLQPTMPVSVRNTSFPVRRELYVDGPSKDVIKPGSIRSVLEASLIKTKWEPLMGRRTTWQERTGKMLKFSVTLNPDALYVADETGSNAPKASNPSILISTGLSGNVRTGFSVDSSDVPLFDDSVIVSFANLLHSSKAEQLDEIFTTCPEKLLAILDSAVDVSAKYCPGCSNGILAVLGILISSNPASGTEVVEEEDFLSYSVADAMLSLESQQGPLALMLYAVDDGLCKTVEEMFVKLGLSANNDQPFMQLYDIGSSGTACTSLGGSVISEYAIAEFNRRKRCVGSLNLLVDAMAAVLSQLILYLVRKAKIMLLTCQMRSEKPSVEVAKYLMEAITKLPQLKLKMSKFTRRYNAGLETRSARVIQQGSTQRGIERCITALTDHKLRIQGEDVVGAMYIWNDYNGTLKNTANAFYFPAESFDPVYDDEVKREHHKELRSRLTPFMGKREALYNTGVEGKVATVRDFVALVHREKAQGDRSAFEDFTSSAGIFGVVHSLMMSACSYRLEKPKPVNRHLRSFVDGVIDVSMQRATLERPPRTQAIMCHRNPELWNEKMEKRPDTAVKFYPFPLSGKMSDGIPRHLDETTDHRYPIAVSYRSIISRQPGCRLTHAYNVATDGAVLHKRREIQDWQLAKCLIGSAKTGKSTQVDVLCNLYPNDKIGNISGNERTFGLQDFDAGKMLAYAQEMGPQMGISTTDLQSAIACDRVRISVKHSNALEFRWLIPIVMAGNMLGPWNDTCGSMLRRLLMFIYNVRFTEDDISNIKDLLEADIGPTVWCMFTAYRDLMNIRKDYFTEEQHKTHQHTFSEVVHEQDLFQYPAPQYFNRSRLHYSDSISTLMKLLQKNPLHFRFRTCERSSIEEITKRVNSINSGNSQQYTTGKQPDYDSGSVSTAIALLGCIVEKGHGICMIQGLGVSPKKEGSGHLPNGPDIEIRAAALIFLGSDAESLPLGPTLDPNPSFARPLTYFKRLGGLPIANEQDFEKRMAPFVFNLYEGAIIAASESCSRITESLKDKDGDIAAGTLEGYLWDVPNMLGYLRSLGATATADLLDEAYNNTGRSSRWELVAAIIPLFYGNRINSMYADVERMEDIERADEFWHLSPDTERAFYLSSHLQTKLALKPPWKYMPPPKTTNENGTFISRLLEYGGDTVGLVKY